MCLCLWIRAETAQASVTVIRALAIGEVRTKDVFKVVRKELRVSLLAALVLGACVWQSLCLSTIFCSAIRNYTLRAVLSASLALTVIMAKLVGCTPSAYR